MSLKSGSRRRDRSAKKEKDHQKNRQPEKIEDFTNRPEPLASEPYLRDYIQRKKEVKDELDKQEKIAADLRAI